MFTRSNRRTAAYTATLLAWVLSCGLVTGHAASQSNTASAEAVKAAFLFNFASYVEWPADALASDEITIGVVGSERIVRELRGLLPGRTIENRQVQVRALTSASSLQNVNILYIGSTAPEEIADLMDAAAERPILVITDAPDGIQRGSMINFVLQDRRVRFEISRGAAERARLKLSSRLLSVALRVHSSGLPLEIAPGSATLALLSRR